MMKRNRCNLPIHVSIKKKKIRSVKKCAVVLILIDLFVDLKAREYGPFRVVSELRVIPERPELFGFGNE